jgi:hypothetical protein
MMVEELSDSALLDGSNEPPPAQAPPNGGFPPVTAGPLPAPTEPVVSGTPSLPPDDSAYMPRRPGLSLILDDIALIRKGEQPKNKLVIGVVGVLALSLVIMMVAGIVSLFSGPSKPEKTVPSARAATTAPPSSATTATTATTAATTATPVAAPTKEAPVAKAASAGLGECTASGDAKLIAPRAVVVSGIEAQALGNTLALGFAASPRDAVAASLDPVTLAPTATVRTRPAGDARHVLPILLGGKLTALPDVERKGDRLVGRRVVATTSLVDIGHADGAIVWAPHGKDSSAKLFAVDGEPQIEALRAIPLTSKKGVALTFRRGNTVFVGAAKGDNMLEADGDLSKIEGLGQVGTPAIAASGDRLMVAWADRTGTQEDWKVRLAKLDVGGTATDAMTFPVPDGGLGGPSMSPSVVALGGGRFFIAWTEGPVASHQVRAVVVGSDGMPAGTPISVSAPGVNAGQPAAVIAPDGHGAVAFLAAKGKALEVYATPISCTSR